MSFGAKEAREPRIRADRRPRVNLCGACGEEVSETELLCVECRNEPTPALTEEHDLSTV